MSHLLPVDLVGGESVEEIDDVDGVSNDLFFANAIANERSLRRLDDMEDGTICGELSSVDEDVSKPEVVVISCSDESEAVVVSSSDSDSDADVTVITSTKSWKRKIRRILDDTELGEETKKKIAIEKERQKRLKSLCGKILFNL
ncbi:hypothetical protein PHJA_002638800 [Phtheirospermum japonicum]|uniref:Uncharacterized protein n=1 Tax=Phtheirospermum japonicum TaxID=374723 RepID=A0A830D018_9LAMI|nr:hypothetical protein PHJA_002638800 [Phtheirospermum japonicum]